MKLWPPKNQNYYKERLDQFHPDMDSGPLGFIVNMNSLCVRKKMRVIRCQLILFFSFFLFFFYVKLKKYVGSVLNCSFYFQVFHLRLSLIRSEFIYSI